MQSQIGKEWIAPSPDKSLAVRVKCTGQTDDDLYALTVIADIKDGPPDTKGLTLKVGRQARNVSEVKFSSDGNTIAVLEFDGYVIVWTKQADGTFSGQGQVVYVGGPIRDLVVDESGTIFTVRLQHGSVGIWARDEVYGKFVKSI